MRRPWLILDRDDTVLDDPGYLAEPGGVRFLPGALSGMQRFSQAGWPLVILTNQSGIGRGYFQFEQLERVHEEFQRQLQEARISLAGLYFCPHAPDDGCACRKPQPLLAERAAEELGLAATAAVVVGDKESDLELGRRFGARWTVQLRAKDQALLEADYRVVSLEELAELLLGSAQPTGDR